MSNYYYNIEDDIARYPEAWCILAIGGRNTGKTYSCLASCKREKRKFIFMKRTGDDVDLLCSGTGKIGAKQNEFGVDLSPFKAINRDLHCNVKAYSIKKGLGGFWNHDVDNVVQGQPIGYLFALNYVTKYKGFEMSECEWLIFDEFIPQPWDRVNRKEGEQLMDLYKTVSRDREHRGLPPLKLLCLANATSISNPTMNILEVTDYVAQMQITGDEYMYLEDRGILIHMIKDNPDFYAKEQDTKIYKAMHNTNWGRMAFENQFAYNDFSNIGRTSLKGYHPRFSICYKNDNYYVYQKENKFYMTSSRHDSSNIYNLNKEMDTQLFFHDWIYELKEASREGRMLFESYTMYDLIVNYKNYFKV